MRNFILKSPLSISETLDITAPTTWGLEGSSSPKIDSVRAQPPQKFYLSITQKSYFLCRHTHIYAYTYIHIFIYMHVYRYICGKYMNPWVQDIERICHHYVIMFFAVRRELTLASERCSLGLCI